MPPHPRNRLHYALLTLVVIGLGLATRKFPVLPDFIQPYGGDILWALMVFLLVGLILPSRPTLTIASLALIFAFAIEISQLYHAPWIDILRHTRLGGLVLGFGFLWSDLACYLIGISLGVLGEKAANFQEKS